MSNVDSVTTESFDFDVLQCRVPVLVDFWASWCPPCRMIAPEIDAVAEEMDGRARMVKVDIDDEPELAERYGVQSIPMLIIFKDGQPVSSMLGAVPRQMIIEELEQYL